MIIFGILCVAIGLAGTLYGEMKNLMRWQSICKPVASGGFLLVAFQGVSGQSTFSILIVIGLMFSCLGDIFLIGKSKKAFLFGLCSFLLAHLLYSGAFIVNGFELLPFLYALLPAGMMTVIVIRWLLPIVDKKMKVPVLAYISVITLMLLFASATCHQQNGRILLSGAMLFTISDLFVARQRFSKKDSLNRLIGLPLYYLAQVLFALSLTMH